MESYKLRITTDETDKVLEIVKKYSSVYLCALENPDTNVHIQCYLETSDKAPTIRKAIKTVFPAFGGNRLYSLKSCDYREDCLEYLAYLLKQPHWKISTLPKELYDKAIEFRDEVKENIKKKKEQKKTVLKQLMELVEEKLPETIENRRNPIENPVKDMIIRVVLSYYQEKEVVYREFQVKSYIQTLLLKYDVGYYSKLFNNFQNFL